MLQRCVVVFVFLFVTIQGIYDPSDESPTKNSIRFHHNYSRVSIQRAVYSNEQRHPTTQIERFNNNGELVRVKRNKTKIEIYSKCPKAATGQYVYELSCNQYLNCWKGRGYVQNCAAGTLFNPKTLECDYAEKVQCVTGPRQSILLHHYEKITEETQPGCPSEFSGIIPHYTDCSKFINCDRGKENVMDCAPGTLFDVNSNNCDYPHKAQCVNQQYKGSPYVESGSGGVTNGHGHYQAGSSGQEEERDVRNGVYSQDRRFGRQQGIRTNYDTVSSDYQQGQYAQNLESSSLNRGNNRYHQKQKYRPVQNVRTTHQTDSGDYQQGQYVQNLDSYEQTVESSSLSGQNVPNHQRQSYRPVEDVGTTHQINSGDYQQGQYDQNLESSSLNRGNLRNNQRQSYRPVQNVRTTHQSNLGDYQQGQYAQNLDFYDQNVEPSSLNGGNVPEHQGQRYRTAQNVKTTHRTNYNQGQYAQNLDFYDQNVESSFQNGQNVPNHQRPSYRPVHNVRTTYQNGYEQGQYGQKVESSSASDFQPVNNETSPYNNYRQGSYGHNVETGSSITISPPRYKPISGSGQTNSNHNFGGQEYARGHQINAFKPVYNAHTGYGQDLQLSPSNGNRLYSQNQQLETGGAIHGEQTEDPKCPEGGSGLYAHPHDCAKFLNCANGLTYIQDCAPGTLFNPLSKICDFPYNVKCTKRDEAENVQQQSGQSYDPKPVQGGGSYLPASSTRRPAGGFHSSQRPHTDEETFYSEQNGNFEHRPVRFGSTERTVGFHPSKRPQTNIDNYEQNIYEQQNRNYQHRPAGNVDQQPSAWIPMEAEPSGFYVTKPPQNHHTPKPSDDYARSYETPEVDYVYEYDDDIIVDAQPAATNKKPQNHICNSGQYTCFNHRCISNRAVCDGFHDCIDGGDEINCEIVRFTSTKNNKLAVAEKKKIANATTVACAKFCLDEIGFQCRAFNYRKHDGVCYLLDRNIGLSGALIIYPIFDYYETTSMTMNCTNLFTCPNNKCIPYSKLCDGQNDCGDRTDEKHCSAHILGYSIRLAGSPNHNEGRIEVSALGKTGFVCDDMFGLKEAEVVCRELGFNLGALEVRGNSYYAKEIGNETTLYLMDDVSCAGNESSLRDCDFNGWGVHNCMAQEIVGVVCKTPEKKCKEGFWQCDNEQECIPFGFLCEGVYDCTDNSDEDDKHCNAPIQLRLANGTTHHEGRVEIKYLGTWGTICDDDFNEDAAKVVCQYFGFHGSASVRKNGYFGPGKGPIWLDQVFCQGNESSVQDCVHWDWGENNCDHSEDVGVVCSESAFVDGTERRRKEEVVEPPKVEPLQLLPGTCGLRKDSIFTRDDEVHFRVVKGSEAKKGDYPWQASVRVKGKSKPTHWCGAVIISQRFVLTAAHCLQGFSKGAYIIVAGDYNVDENEGTEQLALIEDFYLHEEFRKGQKMNNDIALVKLKGNGFTITEDVQPICLPDSDTPYQSEMNCTISGFGSTKSGKAFYSHVLRAGWIPLQGRDVCQMPHIYGTSITEGMICAGFLDEGIDACDGDSGGPLACLYDGVFTLFGLTSWGQHCGYANKPGVYVKVAHYREWIEEKMRKYQ